MKIEKEIIRMKIRIQKAQRECVDLYNCQDAGLRGYEQALHWMLMPSEEK